MIVRNADGTVDHDGEYDPWDDLDEGLQKACVETGGFVMRTGTVILGTSYPKISEGLISFVKTPDRYVGDGLRYVSFK